MGVDQFNELVEDGLLDQSLLVDCGREGGKVHAGFNRFAEGSHEADIDIGGEKSSANFLDHIIKGLALD